MKPFSALLRAAVLFALIASATACSGKPGTAGLLDSFEQQLAANHAVRDVKRSGDDLSFTGPALQGPGTTQWRIHFDSTAIENTDDPKAPYKGIVKSSWFANGQPVRPSATGRDSNLPIDLTNNGLAQDCWANWDAATKKWSWD